MPQDSENEIGTDDLATEVLERIRADYGTEDLDIDTNLIEAGVVDSVGFLDLVEFVESRTGGHIDFEAFDFQDLASIGALCRHVANEPPRPQSEPDVDVAVRAYSASAADYSHEETSSCWGTASDRALEKISIDSHCDVIVDVGCGTGRALSELAGRYKNARCIGIEPAAGMRQHAEAVAQAHDHVEIIDGRFESLPLAERSVGHLISLYAFHWATDAQRSISELARVLSESGRMDLFFTGRSTGHEFTAKTTPVFLEYMGVEHLVASTSVRLHMTAMQARSAFAAAFPESRLVVDESKHTYFDSLDNHWAWWQARASAHFDQIPPNDRPDCEAKIRDAILSLQEESGIPYTIHTIHVAVRN